MIKRLPALAVIILMVAACATTALGKAQQLYSSALEATNTLFSYEYQNRDRLEAARPGTRAQVDVLRDRAKLAFPALQTAMDKYKAGRDAGELEGAYAAVSSLLDDANAALLNLGLPAVKKGG